MNLLKCGGIVLLVVLVTSCGGGGSTAPSVTTRSQLGGAIQGASLGLTGLVSTLAGAPPGANGIGASARFNSPGGITTDGVNLYVVETSISTIRKIVIATGEVTTFAGSGATGAADNVGTAATFYNPTGITTDGVNLYVVDTNNQKIRKIVIATGAVSSLTGVANLPSPAGVADGASSTATFNGPSYITNDGVNLYVVDTNNQKIRKVVIATGAVSSLTGAPNVASPYSFADGAAATATFWNPYGIATDGINLYVADTENHKIRQIVIATGLVSSVTGVANLPSPAGSVDGTSSAITSNGSITATFSYPFGISTDGTNLYVTDVTNHKIRKVVIASGVVSSLTGTTNMAGAPGAVNGAGAVATFNGPGGITAVGTNLYVADTSNNIIRTISTSTDQVTTLAGAPLNGNDGIGAAASFYSPRNVTTDGRNLYVADTLSNKIRKIVIATGAVTTVAGSGTGGAIDGIGVSASFSNPRGITTDGTNLYVADSNNNKIRKIDIATGSVSSLTGAMNMAVTAGAADGPGSTATFNNPCDITTDEINLYVIDSFNNKIRKIVIATGAVSSLTGVANVPSLPGAADGVSSGATFNGPSGITTDGTNLYLADSFNNKIRKIVIATGAVSSLTGVANIGVSPGSIDGVGTSASFFGLQGITTDGTSLYVTDALNSKIRTIAIATGEVSSLTGVANVPSLIGANDGAGSTATFNSPFGVTTDGINLYVADAGNNTIRQVK